MRASRAAQQKMLMVIRPLVPADENRCGINIEYSIDCFYLHVCRNLSMQVPACICICTWSLQVGVIIFVSFDACGLKNQVFVMEKSTQAKDHLSRQQAVHVQIRKACFTFLLSCGRLHCLQSGHCMSEFKGFCSQVLQNHLCFWRRSIFFDLGLAVPHPQQGGYLQDSHTKQHW